MTDRLIGSCHCGAVRFEVSKPEAAVSCNCSICQRYAGLIVHAPPATATVNAPEGATRLYAWGDRNIAFHTCATCGCFTHWSSLSDEKLAVNIRLCPPEDIADVRVRRFDGAKTWAFLDDA